MGGTTSMYNEKNFLEVPLGISFHSIPLNSNYEQSAKCNPTFLQDSFFHPPEISTSQYIAMLSKFSFQKKLKKS